MFHDEMEFSLPAQEGMPMHRGHGVLIPSENSKVLSGQWTKFSAQCFANPDNGGPETFRHGPPVRGN
jgi:hypothetical protein